MNILISSHAFAPSLGGIETVGALLADEFVKMGDSVVVITQTVDGPNLTQSAIPIVRAPSASRLRRLTKWCDVFWHNNLSLRTVWPALLPRKPLVITHQGSYARRPVGVDLGLRIKHALANRVSSVAISRYVASFFKPAPVVIYNPYDAEIFQTQVTPTARTHELLFLGRLVSEKGLDTLLESLGRLGQRQLRPQLTVVGSGPEQANMGELTKRLGLEDQVQFRGAQSGAELAATLNRHQILIVPSKYEEPFGVVALEGIACGCAVIGSNGGGLPEAIGPCGITFPNGDISALENALERLLARPKEREELIAAGPKHLTQFQPRLVAQHYRELFETLFSVILLSHPTANQNVRQAALAFAEEELLAEFWTCLNWKEGGILERPLPARLRNELRRRSFPDPVKPFIKTFPWREAGRLLFQHMGLRSLTKGETGMFSMDAVYVALDRHVARRLSGSDGIKAVYAYDNGALESFRAARSRRLKCIYEHPIVYWREVRRYQQEEAELHPEWKPTLGALQDSEEKLARKDAELALADVVIVPSTFSKDSLKQAPGLKASVHVVPYGAPSVSHAAASESRSGKLAVLFVGALSQAKGLNYLLQAAAKLDRQIDLTLIGKRVNPVVPAPALLDKHRWIPSLAYDDLLREMARHDVLVLPSLHEGFGLVIGEAMAQGLVVIATPHTAAPDLIDDGVDGFIVPIRSDQAIAEKLELLARDPARLHEMKQAARRKAQAHSWEVYRRSLVRLAREVVS